MVAGCRTASLVFLLCSVASGQQIANTFRLSGEVTDPSGARVPHAAIAILGPSVHINSETDDVGTFAIPLADGSYQLIIEAAGFRRIRAEVSRERLESGQPLAIHLAIATRDEHIIVDDEGVDSTSASDQSAVVLQARDLMALSADEGTFQKQLLAFAGGLSGTADIYVDGFKVDKIPPKSSILNVHINRDPYSARYDSLGFGRIEIETKAGGQKLHGSAGIAGTQQSLNARDPFTPEPQPPYYVLNLDGNLSGPMDRKSTFFAGGVYNDQQNNASVNALTPTLFSMAVPNPQTTGSATVRADRQFSQRNLMNVRYQLDRVALSNGGVGQLVLPSQGFASTSTTQTFQLSHEAIPNARVVNQLRLAYGRTRLDQRPEQTATGPCTGPQIASCSVIVQGSFYGGGDPTGVLDDHREHIEAEDFVSIDWRSHFLRAGMRYRWLREANTSTSAFNGLFVFPSIASYTAAQPSQFNLTVGDPTASASTTDLAFYVEDEWRARKDLTLNYGLRFETQTAIPDHFDPAPRFGIAWAPHRGQAKSPLFTLRGGGGLFYDRFQVDNLLTAQHENGVREQSGFVTDPATLHQLYTAGFTSAAIASGAPMVYRVDPNLKSAYDVIANVGLDRRLGRFGSISSSYMWGRGVHQDLSENANAPNPATGLRPLGGTTNVYQFSSNGIEKDQVGLLSWRLTPTPRVTLYGLYIAQDKRSTAQGATVFTSNLYNLSQDFGRIPSARRQQLFSGALLTLPAGFSLNGYFSWQAGAPFNITTGTDLNGDTIYNDRPSFATSASPAASVVATHWGTFNTTPLPGETIIPINYGTAPGLLYLSTSLSRAFTLGGHLVGTGAAAKREGGVQLNFTVEADNLTNNVNAGPPDGVLSSTLFGKSLAQDPTFAATSAANRILLLRTNFTF